MTEYFFKSFFCRLERLDNFLDVCVSTRNKKKTLCEMLNWFFEAICNSKMSFVVKGDSVIVFDSVDVTIASSQMNKDELSILSYMKDNWQMFFETKSILNKNEVTFRGFKFDKEMQEVVKPHLICGRLVASLLHNFSKYTNQREESYFYTAWLIIYGVVINFKVKDRPEINKNDNYKRKIDFLQVRKIVTDGVVKILDNSWNPQTEYYPTS